VLQIDRYPYFILLEFLSVQVAAKKWRIHHQLSIYVGMKKAREEMPDLWLIFLDSKFSEEARFAILVRGCSLRYEYYSHSILIS
jgi:hypothetical protein